MTAYSVSLHVLTYCAGLLSLLLSPALSGSLVGLPLFHRRHPASPSFVRTSRPASFPTSFSTGTTPTPQEPRSVSIGPGSYFRYLTSGACYSFKSLPNAILLATDIAARGLDVPSVDHVVHYQIPRTADAYVHRNGRTARAKRSGFSMLMCGPDERRLVRALLGSLGRREFKSEFHDTVIDYRHICRGKRHPGNVSRAPSPG